MEEGVKQSQTLAAFHFSDNKVDEWTRFKIHMQLKEADADLYPEEQQNGDLEGSPSIVSMDISDGESIARNQASSLSIQMAHKSVGLRKNTKDALSKLDTGKHTAIDIQENVKNMVVANFSIMQFP